MKVTWEAIECKCEARNYLLGRLFQIYRAKVPGGWFIMPESGETITFYPDPGHQWDGNSLPEVGQW
jgi:hypothetical protein